MNKTSAPARLAAALALAATALTAAAVPAQADEKPRKQYPVGGVAEGVSNFLLSPNAVTGVNDWNCKPDADHPNPVVLVHGTGVNLGANWVTMGPTLANEGHCVYAFNYGMGSPFNFGGRVGGLTGVAKSAETMSAFVDKVLAATGAKKVDVLGHSQGGMMPNYYIKRLGGAKKVERLVALAPTNHGTTLSGLVNLGKALGVLGIFAAGFIMRPVGSWFFGRYADRKGRRAALSKLLPMQRADFVERAQLSQPAAGRPDPVGEWRVHQDRPRDREQYERAEALPLGPLLPPPMSKPMRRLRRRVIHPASR